MGPYFFCGIGGSGMLPLALILAGQSVKIVGSDRSFDQGRTPEKFSWIKSQGIGIVPQDGEGLTKDFTALVISSAVEDTIPEVRKAKELGIPILKRAELLAKLFNQSQTSIAIGGTSGKSTTTGMLAWILSQADKNPTVMNGASFLNFVTPDNPYSSAICGDPDLFVAECDESDGSIILYHPSIAVLNNIALDHKPVEELVPIFRTYLEQSKQQVINLNNVAAANLYREFASTALTTGINHPTADINATGYAPLPLGSKSWIENRRTGEKGELHMQVPGKHNVENALSAIGAGLLNGLPFSQCLNALSTFKGVGRRLENVGKCNNIKVIDDFAHNPDKINASLSSLNEHFGRLLIIFQMHGYGPFKLMKDELRDAFLGGMKNGDVLFMPDVLYLGGTANMTPTAAEFINEINEMGGIRGIKGQWFKHRDEIIRVIPQIVQPGDRIVVMGARDDTLPIFARKLLEGVRFQSGAP
ncbi:MAG: Mur ligase family protein [Alphaproteobacteria bacterium]|nr:Mur ligase family protein [Alphaproteobacteria bacterium]